MHGLPSCVWRPGQGTRRGPGEPPYECSGLSPQCTRIGNERGWSVQSFANLVCCSQSSFQLLRR